MEGQPHLSPATIYDDRAARCPDEVGVVGGPIRLTWSQVKERSDALALNLLRRGLRRGDLAMIHLPNSVDLCLARLACDKAGVRPVLVPPSFRPAELTALLAHTRPAAVFCSVQRSFDSLAFFLAQPEPRLVVAACGAARDGAVGLEELCAAPSPDFPPALLRWTRTSPDEPSEIQTTSGTTGTPKCIETSTGARLATARVQGERWRLAEEVLGVFTPAVSGIGGALGMLYGPRIARRVVYVHHFDPQGFAAQVAGEGITLAVVVPAMLSRLVAAGTMLPGCLRTIVSYGAPLPLPLAQAVELAGAARVVQAYGANDFGGVSASRVDDAPEVRWTTVGTILEGDEVEVRDEAGLPVPPGGTGRLYVRGLHGSYGYFRDPARTAAAVRTGFWELEDLVRFDAAGNLCLLGRADDVILRGGMNVYPGDIEELLARHPAVADVAVIGVPDPHLGQAVCACIVPREGASCSFEELAAFLRAAEVASFKLPARWELLGELPRSLNGLKVNRKALQRLLAGEAAGG